MDASKGVTLPKDILIDPDGDVVLVLEGAELQVSSKVLSLASNVFKAMFGPYFAEGKAITSNHPCRVNLSEDDPELMAILCNILHHRTQSVARKPELHFLKQLAILIDKYDCSDSLRSWTQLWLIVLYTEAEDRSAVGRLLYPAFIGDDAQAFQKITRTMVLEVGSNTHSGLYTPYQIRSEIQGLLPDGLLDQLQAAEQKVKSELRLDLELIISDQMLREPYHDTISAKDNCNAYKKYMSSCDCKNILMYLKWLEKVRLWPLETAFVRSTISSLCRTLNQYHAGSTNTLLWPCDQCRVKVDARIFAAAEAAMASFRGLCLDCVKHGGPQGKVGPQCRVTHGSVKAGDP